MQTELHPKLLHAARYEFNVRVVDPAKREQAAELVRRVSGGSMADEFMRDTYDVLYVNHVEDAATLAVFMSKNKLDIPCGFDFETKGWSPRGMMRPSLEGPEIAGAISPLQPDVDLKPLTFQIYWGSGPVYVVAGEFLPLFFIWIRDIAALDGANLGFEAGVVHKAGGSLHRVHRDTIHMDYLLEETRRQWKHDLKTCEHDYLGMEPLAFSVFEGGDFEKAMNNQLELALEYCSFDAWGSRFLADVLQAKLEDAPSLEPYDSLWDFYVSIERQFGGLIRRMDQVGLPILEDRLRSHMERLKQEIADIDADIYGQLGKVINLASNKQLSEYFYKEKGYPVSVTADGYECLICDKKVNSRTNNQCNVHGAGAIVNSPKVDDLALTFLAKKGERVAQRVLDRRSPEKMKNSYVSPLFTRSSPATKTKYPWALGNDRVMHAQFNPTDVVSGRLAAPLALTIPIDYKDAIGVKEESGWRVGTVDLSQIELRLLAHISGDPVMSEAFVSGKDAHTWTGALVESYMRHGDKSLEDPSIPQAMYKAIQEAKKAENPTPEQKHLLERRKHGKCFHPDTEFLTRTGWKRVQDLQPDEEVVQAYPFNDFQVELEWVVPTETKLIDHPSKELALVGGKTVDFKVTPDHRVLAFDTDTGAYSVRLPSEMDKSCEVMPGGLLPAKAQILSDKERLRLRIAVAAQADGSFTANGAIEFRFEKERKVERLKDLLKSITAEFRYFPPRKDQQHRFIIPPASAAHFKVYLEEDKTFPWRLIELHEDDRRLIIDEVKYWDSSIEEGTFRYTSKHKKNCDILQAICSSLGVRSRVSPDREWWRIIVATGSHPRHYRVTYRSSEPWTGKVASISVPSTFVLARFEGTTFVCGQTINFMKVYGGGDEKLASTLGITVDEAKRISEVISKVYAGTQKWMDENINRLKQNPVMFTLRGRHRRIEELQSTDSKTYKEGERLATNQACQAGARDVILGAMLQIAMDLEAGGQYGTEGRMMFGSWVDGEYKPDPTVLPKGWREELPKTLKEGLGALGRMNVQMFGQVHDELDMLWPKEHEEAAIERVVAMMQDPWGPEYQFSIPIIAEASSGLTWKEAK